MFFEVPLVAGLYSRNNFESSLPMMCCVSKESLLLGVLTYYLILNVASPAPTNELRTDIASPEQLRYLLVKRLLADHRFTNPYPYRKTDANGHNLLKELLLLAKASLENELYDSTKVSKRSMTMYCSIANSKQCRENCFYLGDSACFDGAIGSHGADHDFIESGFNPGK